ncbi:MAG TPA: cell envelope integrity protein TolA, partial [Usitatibacter sp.]|nr:cell envelope integrity protein TolA [Usitatibacter sp.]
PVSAELWDKLPTKTAPPPPPPAPEPKPEPKPAPPPKPEPKPEVKPAPPPKPDPAIAEKAEREKRLKEEQERLEEQRQEEIRKKEAAKEKREQEEAAKRKVEQEQLAKKKREEEQRKREEQKAQEEAERARAAAATARQLEMQKWIDQIKAKILSRANVPDTVPTGTEVTVRIRILPGGDVLDIVVTHSASPTYSAAIERAIRSAQPLPVPPANSELFPQFRDLNLNFRHER